LLESSSTFKPSNKPDCSNPKWQSSSPGFALELQAEFNQEFLESLHQLELDDWGRYGKVRQRWEKEIRDPDDVLLQAEERKKQLATQRKKRWHTLTN
jgi:hypothetical protein